VTGVFAIIAALILLASSVTLLAPGATPLDGMWIIKPAEYQQLLVLGPLAGAGFLALAVVAIAETFGALGRRRWAWWVAVVALAVNGLSDAARLFTGDVLEGIAAAAIAGAILWWFARPEVRTQFHR
jgi:hypothetical protein